jgi:hypothetical protein
LSHAVTRPPRRGVTRQCPGAWKHQQQLYCGASARTGRIGDGKIFCVEAAWPEPLEF